jgi:tRNA-2-methylthio-N6-dimethylallyladenosine synthase
MDYHIWTFGCQMNIADSQRLASNLENLGHNAATNAENADILVVNTCVVRQSAEDKAMNRLLMLRAVKEQHPHKIIALMGCMVGVKAPLPLRQKLPFVDVFMPPSDTGPMIDFLHDRMDDSELLKYENSLRQMRDAIQDGDLMLPANDAEKLVSAHVPIVYGCSHACSYCIIPFRRGIERSRRVGEIVAHVRSLALQGVKEVTLLGQIVDRYGKDIPDGPDLSDLLRIVHDVAEETGLERIRFLTSHPNWMTDKLLDTVAALPRVMPHIEVPVQAGNDEVLANMKRGYTVEQYRRLIDRIRARISGVAINSDIIVGFCGETEQQFMDTYNLLSELKLDKVHLARYSPRHNTVSARNMEDDVPKEEKKRRHAVLEELHAHVSAEINSRFLGDTLPILVEDRYRGKWRGRTPQNKLVFFEHEDDWLGKIVDLEITWTGPWSMQGRLPQVDESYNLPVSILEQSDH